MGPALGRRIRRASTSSFRSTKSFARTPQKLYPGMRLHAPTQFRLTRDAEVEIEDDGDQGLRELVREQIRQRRYEPAVRLEFGAGADPGLRQMLQDRFALTPAGRLRPARRRRLHQSVPDRRAAHPFAARSRSGRRLFRRCSAHEETIFDVIDRRRHHRPPSI